ncbi:MAG: hypothetical protein JEZ11_17510 [Desulfobacterales bacterium]|nr:hypothetical protein [Desulfobacterales bacterium]
MKDSPLPPTLEDLKKRRILALVRSEEAVHMRPQAYGRLKTQIRTVITAPVDVDAYYRRATDIAALLRELGGTVDCSIFDPFCRRIDPAKEGCARFFRMDCRDLKAHLDDLDAWRMARKRIRCVK